jgi:hypothetical protein
MKYEDNYLHDLVTCFIPENKINKGLERLLSNAVIATTKQSIITDISQQIISSIQHDHALTVKSNRFTFNDYLIILPPSAHKNVRAKFHTHSSLDISLGSLRLKPWSRSYNSALNVIENHAQITLLDVPPNLCAKHIIQYLLSPFCWVEQEDEAAESHDTSQTYTSVAWCNHMEDIPKYLNTKTISKEIASHMEIQSSPNITLRTACIRINVDA